MKKVLALLLILFAWPALAAYQPVPGTNGQIVYNSNQQWAAFSMAGDCTFTAPNITCTKSGGTAFGTAAFQNTGTSGATIPFLNGNNTYSGTSNFTGTFEISGTTETFPASGLLVGTTDTQTLTNKTLTSPIINTPTITVLDNAFTMENHTDTTKTLVYDLSGETTGKAATIAFSNALAATFTLPAATDTIVGRASTDTLTHKTYDTAGTGNVFKINGTQITAISGNTATVGTTSGTLTSGHCVDIDASGNLVDAGSACGSGGGGVTSISGDGTYITNSGSTGAVTLTVAFGTAALKNTGTSGSNVPLLNGNNTASGNNIQSGTFAVQGTSLPAQAAGTLGIAGTATLPTLGASSEGDIYLTSADGVNVIGEGSTNDFKLFNKNGSPVCTVATGSTNFNCIGLQVGGTNVLTNNQTITLSGDATGSGTTSISVTNTGINGASVPSSDAVVGTNASRQIVAATASGVVGLFTACSGTQYLGADGACHNASGAGTVTSVTFTGDGVVDSSTPSSAVTTSGTVTATILNQNANTVLAGPTSGSAAAPTFRALVTADLPKFNQAMAATVAMNSFGGL